MTDEPRQISGVIDVRVGDDYRVNPGRIERRLCPIAFTQFMSALKQTAIDQHPRAICFEQVFRAGDRTGSSPE